jgi:hypothetical protein
LGWLFDFGPMAARWCHYLYEQGGREDELKRFIADQTRRHLPHVKQPDEAQLNWAVWVLGKYIQDQGDLWWFAREYATPHDHVLAIIDLLTEQEREAIAAAEAGDPGRSGWRSANEKFLALGGVEELERITASQEAF